MRKCITAEERLVATLRVLATGRSYEDLKFSTGVSTSALSKLILQTCRVVYETLREDYMRVSKTFRKSVLYLYNFYQSQ